MADWLSAARFAAQGSDWPEVARLLFSHPDDWPGDAVSLAEIAYWLRMCGHGNRAGEVLDRAAAQADSFAVHQEADALEWRLSPPAAAQNPATLLLDIQDLLQFLHDHGSVSGIQRVQLGILAAVLEGEAGPAGEACLAVFPSLTDGTLWAPPRDALIAILAHCTGHGLNHDMARRLVTDARLRALRVTPAPGAALLILGAFWFYVGAPRFLVGMRAMGLRLGVLIYDMFPVTHPESATADTRQYFMQALGEGLSLWDFAFAISEYSAAAFRRVAAARGARPIEVVAIPLAHSFDLARVAPPAWLDTWPAPLGDLRGREFVLSVSTIEVRKNHLLLFHAWKRMIEAGENPPTLVLVGRPGWGVGDLLAQLEATRWLDGRVMLVHGLSDAELGALYRACLFTVMPSFAEGWGLAVGESLSFGRPCIAANGSALPEVGGDLVIYADPGSVPEWVARLRGWLLDREALAAAAARIGREFKPRRWPEVARHLLDEAARMRLSPHPAAPDALPMRLVPDRTELIGLRDLSLPAAAAAALAQAMAFEAGWHSLEAGLCWLRGRRANVVARPELPAGSPVHVTFDCITPPWPGENGLTVTLAGGAVARHEVRHGQPFSLVVEGVLPEDGMLRVAFELDRRPEPVPQDARGLCVALTAVTLRRQAPAPPRSFQLPAPAARAGELPSVAEIEGGRWADLSSLCAGPEEPWSARRWRLGLAQGLSRISGLGWATSRGHGLVEVPRPLMLALLGAPPAARREMLDAARGGLADLPLRPGDRLLTLGLAADNTPSRMARRAGALVTLVLASTAALLRPHRVSSAEAMGLRDALFTPHSPFDAVLLAVEDAGAATVLAAETRSLPWAALPQPGTADLPFPPAGAVAARPDGCALAESLPQVLLESWELLTAPPPLHQLEADDSAATEELVADCRLVVAPNLAGAWPGLALAARGLGLPCLAGGVGEPSLDPANARANALMLQTMLAQRVSAAAPGTAFISWEAVALAALHFDPLRPMAVPAAPSPMPRLPAISEGWALAATRRS